MVLGANINYEFSFPVKNSIDLLGVTIDKDLNFNCHISQICVKVNKQFLEICVLPEILGHWYT